MNTTKKRFLIKMYTGEPPHELYFIVLMLQKQIIIRPTKKLVATHIVGNLAFVMINTLCSQHGLGQRVIII